MQKTRILVIGATGMLGHTLLRILRTVPDYDVFGTVRSPRGLVNDLSATDPQKIYTDVDANKFDTVVRTLASNQPDVVINCVGVIKQLSAAKDPQTCIAVNALLPHRLAKVCEGIGARLIHISTDCVFSGNKGGYVESDFPDCSDLYGRTKLLGEVDYPHAVTLRTSIIGHELNRSVSLIDWFLVQEGRVRGFTKAIYSGFPTVEIRKRQV
jgi:dTDP-4-dehydrorhamnose reductase